MQHLCLLPTTDWNTSGGVAPLGWLLAVLAALRGGVAAARMDGRGGIQERISAPMIRRGQGVHRTLQRPLSRPTAGGGAAAINQQPQRGSGLTTLTPDGGLTADGLIQERMRMPVAARGTELARTVAARVVSHEPSHYAMLGVGRDFTDAQLRKQHRLLAMRYHPDAAARHGIDEHEATERFHKLQQAYEVLSDPRRRRRYDLEMRLQHRREWRRAWEGAALQLVDRSADPSAALGDGRVPERGAEGEGEEEHGSGGGGGEGGGEGGGGGEMSAGEALATERAEKARRWEAQRLAWLQAQLEAQEASLRSSAEAEEAGGVVEAERHQLAAAKAEEAEARQRAAEAERALRQMKERARRKAAEERCEARGCSLDPAARPTCPPAPCHAAPSSFHAACPPRAMPSLLHSMPPARPVPCRPSSGARGPTRHYLIHLTPLS